MRQELVERLLSAAQMVTSDADWKHYAGDGTGDYVYDVGVEEMDVLKKVVQEISDEAVAEIEKIQREAGAYTQSESCSNCISGACCNCGSLSPWRCGCLASSRCQGQGPGRVDVGDGDND